MNLDRYGGACRCLLRLRENQGNPVISDDAFIRSHLESIPGWELRPGVVDLLTIGALAEELGVATRYEVTADYDAALAAFRAGNEILLRGTPPGTRSDDAGNVEYSLIFEMDEAHVETWEPGHDGYPQVRSHARSAYWSMRREAIVLFTQPLHSGAEH